MNGERSPTEVYKDFRAAVLDILSTQENREAELNGVAGMGRGSDDIPGSIVSVDTAPSPKRVVTEQPRSGASKMVARNPFEDDAEEALSSVVVEPNNPNNNGQIPPVIFVIGGPGSNKASLCLKVVGANSGWTHFR